MMSIFRYLNKKGVEVQFVSENHFYRNELLETDFFLIKNALHHPTIYLVYYFFYCSYNHDPLVHLKHFSVYFLYR